MRKAAYRYRSAVGLLLLAAACAVPACGSDDGASDDLRAKLESDTGVAWGVAVDPRSNAPRILSPSAPVRLGSGAPEADARAFFDRYDPSILNTVGCAWYAVGALTLDASVSPLAASLVCPTAPPGLDASAPPAPPAPPTTASGACSGHANGWMCDPAAPETAYRCNGGAAAGTVSCADLAGRCKPRSATDPTATVDSSGALTCE